jgi:hypothetical protein
VGASCLNQSLKETGDGSPVIGSYGQVTVFMKRILNGHVSGCIFLLCFLPTVGIGAGQFVELTTGLQICDWDYLFFYDRNRKLPDEASTASIFAESNTRRCVIGADTWMIKSTFPTFEETRWFTGTNIIAHTVVTKQTHDTVTRQSLSAPDLRLGILRRLVSGTPRFTSRSTATLAGRVV